MRQLAIAALAAFWVGAADAGSVVVELFTSQGCSSCPPADQVFGELAEREDVIALSFHVDYWDYIGWKDSFANPAFSERQRRYARAMGEHTVYTPQMIVDGAEHVVGSKPMKIARALDAHRARPDAADVTLSRKGREVTATVRPNGRSVEGGAVVWIATYIPEASVAIRRGENAGRRLAYHNIVRGLSRLGTWDGKSTFRATAEVTPGMPVVVMVQRPGYGPMLGAARLR